MKSDGDAASERFFYRLALEDYLDKGVATMSDQRYLTSLFAATAARAMGDDSSDDSDSDKSDNDFMKGHQRVVRMDLIDRTQKGVKAHNDDEGDVGIGLCL